MDVTMYTVKLSRWKLEIIENKYADGSFFVVDWIVLVAIDMKHILQNYFPHPTETLFIFCRTHSM